ncbi:ABC transporter permease [Anaeroselena agilis]|uniref:ABC transporter permease n=1 Tax=Anaeroselena agilis TaxID=3063788 RepID=A0ABU3P0U2_9FIRM|nr:ABC transporter permease [Selenomonadales bacterium 4137-cl]
MSCAFDKETERRLAKKKLHFLQHKLLDYLVTIGFVVIINFLLPRLLPGDPFAQLSGLGAGADFAVSLDAASEAALREYYGLDKPLGAQFVHYLQNLLTGNLGYAYYFKAPVGQLLAERLPWSLLLLLTSILLASVVGIACGVFAAWRRGTAWDHGLRGLLLGMRTVPPFFLGSLLLLIFSVKGQWFPVSGAFSVDTAGASGLARLKDIIWHLALPAATLTLAELSGNFMLTRSAMLDTLREDYITFGRARGLSESRLMFGHALPNALLPVITHTGLRLGLASGIVIYVEKIFGYPGIGMFMYEALAGRDFQVLQGGFLVISLTVLLLNLTVDILYAYLDPRVEVS